MLSIQARPSAGKAVAVRITESSYTWSLKFDRHRYLSSFADRSYPSKFGFDGSGGSTTAIVTVLVVGVVVLSLALLALRPGRPERRLSRDFYAPEETQRDEEPEPPAINLAPEFQSPRYETANENNDCIIVRMHVCF